MTIGDVGLISGRPAAIRSTADVLARSTASLGAKRASGFNVTVHASIHEIDPDEWNEIVGEGRAWQTHAALALLQDGGIEDYRARYLVLRTKDGRIAAHTTAYIIETDLLIFSQGVLKLLLDKIRRVLPNFLRPSILECGCPVSAGNPICLREGIAYADVLAPLCDALEQIAAKEGIRFLLLRDFVDEELAELPEWAGHGFSRIPNLPSTELAIKWRSFEEYVLAMRSRHRQKIRRGLRFAQRAGLSARWTNEFAGMVDELARQWSNVNAQAKEYSRDRLTPEFFRNLNSAFGSRCRLLQILHDERMVAHALVVSDGPLLRWILFGRENGEARDGAYFLVIARIIAFAIEQGSERIEMGLTTYSPKTDFGARMVPLWMFARVRGVLPRMLVPMLFRLLNPVPDIRDRACFRSPEDAVLPEPAS